MGVWATWTACHAGKPAGMINGRGYRIISLNNVRYLAHRLIWKWMTGEEPPETLDHKDRAPDDNRWEQLRTATPAQQTWNRGLNKNNTSGFCGVKRCPSGRYGAYTGINRIQRSLGTFDTAEEAAAVAEAVRRSLRGKFYSSR